MKKKTITEVAMSIAETVYELSHSNSDILVDKYIAEMTAARKMLNDDCAAYQAEFHHTAGETNRLNNTISIVEIIISTATEVLGHVLSMYNDRMHDVEAAYINLTATYFERKAILKM